MVLHHHTFLAGYVFLIHITVALPGVMRSQFQLEEGSVFLIWAVKLDMQTVAPDHAFLAANIIASDTGLLNLGQIGGMFGYFALKYNGPHNVSNATYSRHEVDVSSRTPFNVGQQKNEEHQMFQWTLLNKAVSQAVSEVNQKLDQHSFVEWHSQQRTLSRSRRTKLDIPHFADGTKSHHADRRSQPLIPSAIYFNDPLFSKQWHLVSI
jgi:hypothetical protein